MTISSFLIGFVCIVTVLQDVFPLKNVILTIEPKIVSRLHHSTLRCQYELEANEAVYAVKWYRGRHEFYRYTPSERPNTKTFPYAGITVDVSSSNSTQVVLRDIEFNLSGNFSCEVTTDATFSTGIDTQTMLVVQLPDHSPAISVGREPLDYGDTLRANCTSPPSRPPALLQFFLNNLTVARSEPLTPRKALEQAWSDLALEMVLSEYHFHRGRLILRCVAQIRGIYHEEAELALDSAREPISERVSAVDSANTVPMKTILQLVLFSYILIFYS